MSDDNGLTEGLWDEIADLEVQNANMQENLLDLEAENKALREAAQDVLEDVEQGPIGKNDLCLTQLAALLEVKSDEV